MHNKTDKVNEFHSILQVTYQKNMALSKYSDMHMHAVRSRYRREKQNYIGRSDTANPSPSY